MTEISPGSQNLWFHGTREVHVQFIIVTFLKNKVFKLRLSKILVGPVYILGWGGVGRTKRKNDPEMKDTFKLSHLLLASLLSQIEVEVRVNEKSRYSTKSTGWACVPTAICSLGDQGSLSDEHHANTGDQSANALRWEAARCAPRMKGPVQSGS